MAYEKLAGPSATARYGDYKSVIYYDKGKQYTKYVRKIIISGTGRVENIDKTDNSLYRQEITVFDNITELADECFNHYFIDSITLPKTLKKIGNNCFSKTAITTITLPEGLEEMGEDNFPSSLYSVNIPDSLKTIPMSNLSMSRMSSITISDTHPTYKTNKGILYTRDMTEMLICCRTYDGPINIPNGVTRIGDYCFCSAKHIPVVMIPPTVKCIGKYAMSGMVLNRLSVPNSVETVGEGCFNGTEINGEFRFSQNVTELPDHCFNRATVPHLNFLENIRTFGKECMYYVNVKDNTPIYRLTKAERIEERAFFFNQQISTIEIYPCLRYVGHDAFYGTKEGITVWSLSYAPMPVNPDAFCEQKNAVLCVPEKTTRIYEQSSVWGTFGKIQEMPPSREGSADDPKDAGMEVYRQHLKGLYESLVTADRSVLSDTLKNLMMYYTAIEDDATYEEVLALLKYNRMFNPPIVPDYEKYVQATWSDVYRLKMMETGLTTPQLLRTDTIQQTQIQQLEPTQASALDVLASMQLPVPDSACEVKALFTGIQEAIEEELDTARQTVRVAVSWFTNYGLMQKLKELAGSGVHVEVVINNDAINNGGYCLDFNELIKAGVDLSLMEWPEMMHHKYCVIDGKTVITGSYNWTRFSAKNHENVVIIRNTALAEIYSKEFDKLLQKVKYLNVTAMPDTVPEKPEYDRHAFRQYVTEDLDAAAKQVADERDKITALHKAAGLNREYLRQLSPTAESDYQEAFKVLDMQQHTASAVVSIVEKQSQPVQPSVQQSISHPQVPQQPITVTTVTQNPVTSAPSAEKLKEVVAEVEAERIYMAVDVSGSMKSTFEMGHVKTITQKALAAALTLAKDKSVALWTFGSTAKKKGIVTLEDMSKANLLCCANTGTVLSSFVNEINDALPDGALVLVLTDDDGRSINNAVPTIRTREKVYWQFLTYEKDCTHLETALKDLNNASLVYLSGYRKKTDEQLTAAMLEGYLDFMKKEG